MSRYSAQQIPGQINSRRLLDLLALWLLVSLGIAQALAETVTYFHNDIAGTPIAASDASGNVIWKENYQPFGGRMNNLPASGSNDQWFAGKPVETATGLSYFGARYYDPALGRFMGIDPKEVDPGNLHSFNRYSYGNNNPYRYKDPDGRHPVLIVVVGVGLWVGTEVLFPQTPPAHAPDAIFPTTFPDVSAIGAKAILTLERAALRGAAETTAKEVAAKEIKAIVPYKRPSGATTTAQRESVQGKPCVKCGATTDRQVAGHKEALVKEHYETGTIDRERMRSLDAVQPECPTCSAREGAEMSRYSREMRSRLEQQ